MQNMPPEDAQNQTAFTPLVPSTSESQQPLDYEGKPENHQSLFYTQDQDGDLDLQLPSLDEQSAQASQNFPFVLPFQNSASMPTIADMKAQSMQQPMGPPPPAITSSGKKRWESFPLLKMLLIGSVVLITVIGASLFVFAQSVPSPNATEVGHTHTTATKGISPAKKPTQEPPTKTKTPTNQSLPKATATPSRQVKGTQGSDISPSEAIPSTQFLNQIGWTQAGLTLGDVLEALRTGGTFTDREMSYDYRNIGTPANHSGTLTGATFLLTTGGLARFIHNDVRMINNALYDKIHTEKIIQQVVNTQSSLVQFQSVPIQGQQHQFAWVNVAFELLQSKIDPTSGKRTERLEINPATGQPALHHMAVILVRIPPQNQGENAPMGGTGWLVDTYALDTNTLPAIATDPSL